MADDPVLLRPTAEVASLAQAVADAVTAELAALLPHAEVEHVGATAHAEGWTKGDVDLSVVVDADRFDDAVAALQARHPVAQPENWTPTYASFSVEGRDLPVGLQVAVKGSDSDFLVDLRDRFRAEPDRLKAYDDAKRAAAPHGKEAYWEAKDAFLTDWLPGLVTFPGAQRPERRYEVDSDGVGIAVSEWGPPDAPPLLLAHGGFDFVGTYDVFAPLLAAAGWRVVAWDFRGHGDSDRAALYSWQADLRDALAVLDSLGPVGPIPFVGHSKGAGVLLDLAEALPHRVSHVVNLDGMPSYRNQPDRSDHERTRMLSSELAAWLDHRRASATKVRRAGTLHELAKRRRRMNPRLSLDWLRYLVTVGGRKDEDGWRWKIDPGLRMGGFGPWRPEWSLIRLPGIRVPFLGILAGQPEVMGWGTQLDDLLPWLPDGAEVETFEDAGHFVHIEQPHAVADRVLAFLA